MPGVSQTEVFGCSCELAEGQLLREEVAAAPVAAGTLSWHDFMMLVSPFVG